MIRKIGEVSIYLPNVMHTRNKCIFSYFIRHKIERYIHITEDVTGKPGQVLQNTKIQRVSGMRMKSFNSWSKMLFTFFGTPLRKYGNHILSTPTDLWPWPEQPSMKSKTVSWKTFKRVGKNTWLHCIRL